MRYRDLLTEHLLPKLEKDDNRINVIFQQNNARIHTSKLMEAFLSKNK